MEKEENTPGKNFLKKVKSAGNKLGRHGKTIGAVILDNTVYPVNEELSQEMDILFSQDCKEGLCLENETKIRDFCREEQFPPNHKVLICTDTGYCCNCYCH